jgi:hypothetical protein
MLTFEVVSFDIGYNYILERSCLLKFMAVIHTAYATMKMPGPKGIITIKVCRCFFAPTRYMVVKIMRSISEVVLQIMKHTMIYLGSSPSSEVIVLCLVV